MLILTRKVGEVVVIGENEIRVMVVEILGEAGARGVRLGIEADQEVAVHRLEVYERITAGLPVDDEPPAG